MKQIGVILAALAGAAVLFAGCGGPPRGLSLAPNWRLIQVYTQQGKAMYLNAAVTPVLFFAPDAKDARAVEAAAKAIGKLHGGRPVLLVATDLGGSPAQAAAQVQAWEKAHHVSLPALEQAGPPDLYVRRVSELVWIGRKGHRHEVTVITKKVLEEAAGGR